MHQMIDGRVVPEAQKFRNSNINLEFEGKLDQMFMGIDVDNDMLEENKEENVINVVHISNDVHIDGNNKKKTPGVGTSHFKTERKKSLKQIGGVALLSSQIEKLCNATDNMSQAKCSLTPVMDPYGIPKAVKVLDSLSEEVPEASDEYGWQFQW
ncbi:hypothetical protein Gogos_000792 [Gossypium gossypioides]|uniref:Uncharacterized protein n=1 Tax=Gossypium gossypioides TaxID=34282 RepID=A0A7J9CTY1_GOSGO|nr:hypothetical protein [Gossypium gossypioides]